MRARPGRADNLHMMSLKMFWWRLRRRLGSPRLLCDTCKYDYPSACGNPDRPNATSCPEYRRR